MSSLLAERKTVDKLYTARELSLINQFNIPSHIAVIMDGNRRWARRQGLPAVTGHWRGAENLSRIVRAAAELGVKVLTVFGFSTENWKRSPMEIRALMRIFKAHLQRQKAVMVADGVRLSVIGDVSKFPQDVQRILQETLEATKDGKAFDLVLALNYGARDEIKRAVEKIVADCTSGRLSQALITEDLISSYLDTAKWEDPDLLIRPSGESRLSNFLLWQISYAEVILTQTHWPEFDEHHLLEAVVEYQKREQRLGK